MTLELHYQRTGEGYPLLILHGLFGTLTNWQTAARGLAPLRSVYTLDLRNHGRSPHSDDAGYAAMAGDIFEFLDRHRLPQADLLGHSLGGKVAMVAALRDPSRISALVVADMTPRATPPRHDDVFGALDAFDPATVSSRAEADAAMAPLLPDPGVRQFLLTNLQRGEDGRYRWRMNLPVLRRSYAAHLEGVDSPRPYPGPALFVAGARSSYVTAGDHDAIHRLFPAARILTLPDSGHWVHVDQPALFLRAVQEFLA
jgi:pimeloyl-ACP methyl ester carboxylesterase